MSFWFYLAAIVFFFLAGLSVAIIPNPLAWGLLCVAIGLLLSSPVPFKT